MKHAPEYVLEIITDGKRSNYSFVGPNAELRALASLHAAADERDVISIELHIVLPRKIDQMDPPKG